MLVRRVSAFELRLGLHQPRVDEIGAGIGERRVLVGIREYRRDAVSARQRQVLGRHEARVPHLHRMAQREAAEPVGQELEKRLEIEGVECLGGRELPDDGSKLRSELGQAAAEETLDRFAGLAEDAPVGREAIRLDRKDEVVWRRIAPLREARGALRAIVGGVDLDRRDATAEVLELASVRQASGIEVVAPGLVDPAADTDANPRRGLRSGASRWRRPGPDRRRGGCRCWFAGTCACGHCRVER